MTQKIERKEVEKLAALARITIPENEIEKVRSDMESILAYISQINEANEGAQGQVLLPREQYNFGVKNVIREDAEPHETGKFTDALLAAAPKTKNGFIAVKKIL
jgi:aspartyl/glutamyl-tRNA(Asn/Gln) amidotransferase C subunit